MRDTATFRALPRTDNLTAFFRFGGRGAPGYDFYGYGANSFLARFGSTNVNPRCAEMTGSSQL
jgi:hypothetical protein